jgi:protein AFG1
LSHVYFSPLTPENRSEVSKLFADLCNKPLSAADYIEVTNTFKTVFVEDVPRMGLGERDQARRFITFIDGESRRCRLR